MRHNGQRPLAIGFWFSLGHATVVCALALGVVFAAAAVTDLMPALRSVGAFVGGGVSGTFLCVIGVLNLLVLVDIVKGFRRAHAADHGHAHVEQLLAQRGFITLLKVTGPLPTRLPASTWGTWVTSS